MGRPRNSKNKKGHSAGGDRRSEGFVASKEQENQRKKEMSARQAANREERKEQERKAAQERQERLRNLREKRIEEAYGALHAMSKDGLDSLLTGAFDSIDDDDDDGDDDDDYDPDEEEEDYDTDDEGEGEVKARRLRRKAAYKPIEGSTLDNDFKQFHNKIGGNPNRGQQQTMTDLRASVMRRKQRKQRQVRKQHNHIQVVINALYHDSYL